MRPDTIAEGGRRIAFPPYERGAAGLINLDPNGILNDLTDNFPGNSGLGPLIKKKTSMKGKYPDTTVGGGIPRNYAFMNEIGTANIQGKIHGCLVKYGGVMKFIHTMYHEFF